MPPDPSRFHWMPNIDVLVNAEGELVIKVELSELKKEDVELTVEGQQIRIAGVRPDRDAEGARYLVRELHHGKFESVVDLPEEYDASRARANYQNGMLRIVAPRRMRRF